MKSIGQHVYQLELSNVNAFLITAHHQMVLIDTGSPNEHDKLIQEIKSTRHDISRLSAIILTHYHADHAGGCAAIHQLTGAPVYIHALDAPYIQSGNTPIPAHPAPGLLNKLLYRLFIKPAPAQITPIAANHVLKDGDNIDLVGGLEAIHVPGHTAGQIALLWAEERILFAADAAANVMGLGYALGYDDIELGQKSLQKLSAYPFDIACFGHGSPIKKEANARFAKRFAS